MSRISFLVVAFTIFFSSQVNAQYRSKGAAGGASYQNAVGLSIDFGTGSTLVGPAFKHFFSARDAGQFEILFGDNVTFIQAFYEYHGAIENASGLKWYVGIGPGVALYKNGSTFLLRPIGGLDYKINNVPLNFSFDWRPWIAFGDNDTDFEPARFGLGFRYAF